MTDIPYSESPGFGRVFLQNKKNWSPLWRFEQSFNGKLVCRNKLSPESLRNVDKPTEECVISSHPLSSEDGYNLHLKLITQMWGRDWRGGSFLVSEAA